MRGEFFRQKKMQLSKNFTLSELTRSQTASRLGINNVPNAQVIANLRILCENILQPVRDNYGLPVVVSSGYRSPELNRKIKGSRTSQHMTGHAVDFEVPTVENLQVANWIKSNLSFDQLILEFWTGGNSGWIHCSYVSPEKNKKQLLTINSRGTFQGFRLS